MAQEAMHCRSLEADELLNVRWAYDDPNPKVTECVLSLECVLLLDCVAFCSLIGLFLGLFCSSIGLFLGLFCSLIGPFRKTIRMQKVRAMILETTEILKSHWPSALH